LLCTVFRLYSVVRNVKPIGMAANNERKPVFEFLAAAVIALAPQSPAPADPVVTIQEDDPRWSCVDDANKICGPNSNGVPAGRYDEGDVLIDPWPVA
jgi:hypothetical protein